MDDNLVRGERRQADEIPGLQIVFILIVLAEWIFMGSTQVFRGYMAERWEMPVGLKSAGYAAAFGILFAYYIGERLIYRKSLTAPSRLSCAAGESFGLYYSMSHICFTALQEM